MEYQESASGQSCGGTNFDQGQKFAFDAFLQGCSVAVIGGAGSGKSFFLQKLIQCARSLHGEFPFVAPCALCNKAAEAMNGMTIHRLFAAKPSWEFNKEHLTKNIKSNTTLCNRLRQIRVLIIDEISLLTSNVLDSIDFVLRELAQSEWHSSLPLGGRQLIVTFHPFQFEPHPEHDYVQREVLHTAYQSRLWYLTFGPPGDGVVVLMGTNHRQSRDLTCFQILNRIRIGKQTLEDITVLNRTSEKSTCPPKTHTRLCLTNRQVAKVNEQRLRALPGLEMTSAATDMYRNKDELGKKRLESLRKRLNGVAQEELRFKVGAKVMLTKKINDFLPGTHAVVRKVTRDPSSSSSRGYELELEAIHENTNEVRNQGMLTRFFRARPEKFEIHSYDCRVIACREQLPLIPAYALTVHRSQGMSLHHVAIEFDRSNNWKPTGMVYVALSRCRTFSGLWVKYLGKDDVTVSGRAQDFMEEIRQLHIHRPLRMCGSQYLPVLQEAISVDSAASPRLHTSQESAEKGEVYQITSNTILCRGLVEVVETSAAALHVPVAGKKRPKITEKQSLISKRRFQYRPVLKENVKHK